jgi:putative ABC transport system ATP-binding protein
MPKKPIISLRDLCVTYMPGRSNEVKALQGITFDIFPGEYIIFFGPSGCGKSTLLYSIAGLERNVTGDIVVQDRNLAVMDQYELEEYHQTVVGMIFQSFYLIGSLTVEQNVALPQVAIRKLPAERLARARELLEKFGVGKQARKLPTELSGGQQQRVAICRSVMNDPSIVIADEPVGNLDSKSSHDVMDLLRHLNEVQKKTVILVTHDPSHLNHANRIFFLRDGKVIGTKENTPEERAQAVVNSGMLQTAMKTLAGGISSPAAAEKGLFGKGHEIFAEAVVGMSAQEMADLESRISHLVEKGRADRRSIIAFLTKPIQKGGIGMLKHKAEQVADDVANLIHQTRRVGEIAERNSKARHSQEEESMTLTALEARVLRRYFLDLLDIRLANDAAAVAVETVIRKRLEESMDMKQMQKTLCASTREHGAGMSARAARLLARRIELLVKEPSKHGPTGSEATPAATVPAAVPGALPPPADDEDN